MIHRIDTVDAGTGTTTTVVYDTTAQTVTTTIPPGAPVTRPMTPVEITLYTATDAEVTHQTNTAQMVEDADPAVDKLVATINALNAITDMTNATINANPAAVIKNLTRECKTIARQLNHQARLTSGRTESTDTGPVTDV